MIHFIGRLLVKDLNSHLIAVYITFNKHKYLLIDKCKKSSSTYDQYSFVHIRWDIEFDQTPNVTYYCTNKPAIRMIMSMIKFPLLSCREQILHVFQYCFQLCGDSIILTTRELTIVNYAVGFLFLQLKKLTQNLYYKSCHSLIKSKYLNGIVSSVFGYVTQ